MIHFFLSNYVLLLLLIIVGESSKVLTRRGHPLPAGVWTKIYEKAIKLKLGCRIYIRCGKKKGLSTKEVTLGKLLVSVNSVDARDEDPSVCREHTGHCNTTVNVHLA